MVGIVTGALSKSMSLKCGIDVGARDRSKARCATDKTSAHARGCCRRLNYAPVFGSWAHRGCERLAATCFVFGSTADFWCVDERSDELLISHVRGILRAKPCVHEAALRIIYGTRTFAQWQQMVVRTTDDAIGACLSYCATTMRYTVSSHVSACESSAWRTSR